ncbi:MAG: NADAR family protein [Niabella sp.]|nr:NADAR family protein [Niabella sp.]
MSTIKFYKVNEPYGFFSNFAPYPIVIKHEIWKTVEHYFQASKFEDERIKLKIGEMNSPMDVAKEGRKRTNEIRTDWENVKDAIMHEALLCKFSQHPKLRKALVLTADSVLIEHTKNDFYWADGGDGTGKNRLGMLLMNVRDELQKYSKDPDLVLPPWIAFPHVEQHDLFWGMGFGEDYFTQWATFYLKTDKNQYRQLFPENKDWEGVYD